MSVRKNIKRYLPTIQENVTLANYTTFKIGGSARYFYIAKNKEDLIKAIEGAQKCGLPFFILGGGSNILVSDKGYKGIVIKIKNQKLNIKNTSQKSKIIRTGAGTPLSLLVSRAAEGGWVGLEWAVGIPGTAGGAIRGNAGAFGGCMADVVKSVEALEIHCDKNQKPTLSTNSGQETKNQKHKLKIKKFNNKNCGFGYRDSIFKRNENLIILSCEIGLKRGKKKEIKGKMEEYLDYRQTRHPKEPSAGCVFKNVRIADLHPEPVRSRPCVGRGFGAGKYDHKFHESSDRKFVNIRGELVPVRDGKIAAAYLIEKCGLKGKKIRGAVVSEKHANFIVNRGNAQAKDVTALVNLIKQKVRNKFGIFLEEEIQYLGF